MINLKTIDAKTGDKNQKFNSIGETKFTCKKGELRYERKAGKTFVYGDTDDDGKVELKIDFFEVFDLTVDDFVL